MGRPGPIVHLLLMVLLVDLAARNGVQGFSYCSNWDFVGKLYEYRTGSIGTAVSYFRMEIYNTPYAYGARELQRCYDTSKGRYIRGPIITSSNSLYLFVVRATMYAMDEAMCVTAKHNNLYTSATTEFLEVKDFLVYAQGDDDDVANPCPAFDPRKYMDVKTWLARRMKKQLPASAAA